MTFEERPRGGEGTMVWAPEEGHFRQQEQNGAKAVRWKCASVMAEK
jgi:hypothetical protein